MAKTDWDLYPEFRESFSLLMGKSPVRLLTACSGGPDSMALWDLLERLRADDPGVKLFIGHVDHGLRGRASSADAAFVRREARRRGTPCLAARAPVRAWAREKKKGLEESARILRYEALAAMARRARCSHVATAHNLNDQAETLIMNIIRGAGPSGLGAMAPSSPWPLGTPGPVLVRPLLGVGRRRILRYLRNRRLPFRRDASNDDPVFLRNSVRPILNRWEKARPGFLARAARLAEMQRDEEDFWRIRLGRRPLFRRNRLDLRGFMRYHKSEQRRILRRLCGLADFAALERVRALAAGAGNGRLTLPGGWVEKKARSLIFHSIPAAPVAPAPAGFVPKKVAIPGKFRLPAGARLWEMRARFVPAPPQNWKRSASVFADADRLDRSSLRWRTWKAGDRFRPLGMSGSKKLSDFFIDLKLPREQRSSVPLLEDRGGIVWVVGKRLADRVKITPSTRRVVELSARPAGTFRRRSRYQ
ncbi:MAG: tRNA lysidine(34) synthetase TilS [Elusimicrobiota bacterium]